MSGGAERTIYEVGRRLINKGNELKWFSVVEGSLPTTEVISGISINRLPSNEIAHLLIPIILRREKHDVVVDDLGHAVPWGSEYFCKGVGTVFFHHLHKRSLKGQVSIPFRFMISEMESLYPIIYRKWPFVTESNSSIGDLISLGIRKDRIVKILPGLNPEDFRNSEKTKDPSIVYFGGFRNYKRPWEVLFVLREILKTRKEIHLYMVGNGPSLEKVKQIAKDIAVTEHVTFAGRLEENYLKRIVGQSWINIHSAVTEGFGFSILEASALGTPTVAYDVNGVNEAIENGVNGILVEDGNRNEMASAISKILDGYSGNWVSSSSKVAKKYSWDKTAEQWNSHLEHIRGL